MASYGREQQQKKTNGILQKNTLQAALIFGRRRVGKSELIKQCLKKQRSRSLFTNVNRQQS